MNTQKLSLIPRFVGLFFTCMAALTACSTVRQEIVMRASELGYYKEQSELFGFKPQKQDYVEAQRLWPWVEGTQWHRRALILSLKPNPEDLAALHKTRDSQTEYDLIEKLIASKTVKTTKK